MESKRIIDDLRSYVPGLVEVEKELETEFFPKPVGMISLYSAVGWKIVECSDQIKEPHAVFDLIERALLNGDDTLKNAVNTGLIEAIIAHTDADPGKWAAIFPHFGATSAEYAKGWIKFTNNSQL